MHRRILRGVVLNTAVEKVTPILPPYLPQAGQEQPVYIRPTASNLASVDIQPIDSLAKASTEL